MQRAVVDGKGLPLPLTQALSFEKPPFPPATALYLQLPPPFCHPERTRISCCTALIGDPDVVLFKENHTQLTEAATLDRKSGEAEGPAVRHSCAPPLPVHNPHQIIDRISMGDRGRTLADGRLNSLWRGRPDTSMRAARKKQVNRYPVTGLDQVPKVIKDRVRFTTSSKVPVPSDHKS
jgi:hypothetical protein